MLNILWFILGGTNCCYASFRSINKCLLPCLHHFTLLCIYLNLSSDDKIVNPMYKRFLSWLTLKSSLLKKVRLMVKWCKLRDNFKNNFNAWLFNLLRVIKMNTSISKYRCLKYLGYEIQSCFGAKILFE